MDLVDLLYLVYRLDQRYLLDQLDRLDLVDRLDRCHLENLVDRIDLVHRLDLVDLDYQQYLEYRLGLGHLENRRRLVDLLDLEYLFGQ